MTGPGAARTVAEGGQERSPPADVPILGLAYATTVVAISAVSPLAPNLPELAVVYGVEVEAMAWIQTAVIIPGVMSAGALMQVARRLGVIRVLAAALFLYGAAGALNFWHASFELAVAARFVQGIGGGALTAASFALIARLPREQRQRGIARNAALIGLMMVMQPLVGSGLGELSPRAPFLFYLTGVVLAAVVLRYRGMLPPGDRRTSRAFPAGTTGHVLALLAMTLLVNGILFGWLLYLAPIYLAESLGLGVAERGLVLALQSASGAVVALGSRRMLSRDREAMLLVAASALTLVALPVVALTGDAVVAVTGLFVAGASFGLANPAIASLVTSLSADAGSGWWQSSARLGQMLGPLLGAAILARFGVATALMAGALVGPLGFAAAWTVRATRPASGGE